MKDSVGGRKKWTPIAMHSQMCFWEDNAALVPMIHIIASAIMINGGGTGAPAPDPTKAEKSVGEKGSRSSPAATLLVDSGMMRDALRGLDEARKWNPEDDDLELLLESWCEPTV
ncbi:hypothetical protein E2562_024208 [Oryza meyeriana var. granulata]|uniref:Uncharacterized protein n=1 Tax=Oryza meyeriana var. granulata TaxID=110450 RepID=A0A6G1BZS6_9ORYZ|nr:hypothetical protein E2562_024208 [Oryza meyeriana var. granulata]